MQRPSLRSFLLRIFGWRIAFPVSLTTMANTYPSQWFDGIWPLQELPEDCIRDCSSQGRVDDAVEYWVSELQLTAPPWLLRRYLRCIGAWDRAELCDHEENLKRLLWLWACQIKEAWAAGETTPLFTLSPV